MDTPPVPRPRVGHQTQNEGVKRPVPLPRKQSVNNEKITASDILRSIGTVSKQITEDVALKVSNSARNANEKIEKSFIDGSRFARGTLEKTLSSSRAMRDSVTKTVIEGTKSSLRLRKCKKSDSTDESDSQRCVSMPVVDLSLFDNIQFHSPLVEQMKCLNDNTLEGAGDISYSNLNNSHLDDVSLFSRNSDSYTDTVSNFSQDSHENDPNVDSEQLTYDTPKQSRTNSIVSIRSVPEVPQRQKKKQLLEKQVSMYENWVVPCKSSSKPEITYRDEMQESTERPSKSTIYEFDPLNSTDALKKYDGISNELILLESFLVGDTYGTILSTNNSDESFEMYSESDYFNPPLPPERTDSLVPEIDTKPSVLGKADADNKSTWFLTDSDVLPADSKHESDKPSNSVMQRFSSMLKFDNMLNKTNKQLVLKVEVVERPPINSQLIYQSGMLTRIMSGVVEDLFKNTHNKYCVYLTDQKMMCYSEGKESTSSGSVLKEAYTLDSVYSLQLILPLSSSTNNNYCFELTLSTAGVKSMPKKVIFSCPSTTERRSWTEKIAQQLTTSFPAKYIPEFTRVGWCYLKVGVSSEWSGAWLMLVRRVLVYYTTREDGVQTVDLRKTRCIVTQEADEEAKLVCPTDGSDALLLDCPHNTIYLRFPHERELKGWRSMIKLAAHNNGTQLHHQQLTKDDVPTVVEKCISFIYAHGSLSEGIYRRAGSSVTLTELLSRFRRDAWSVQLSPGQHTEHDAAGVVKRFFRDLPEPLMPQDKHQELLNASEIKDLSARLSAYRSVITTLSPITGPTCRKLFAHLHFLHTMSFANKMTADNMAAVWSPTIMPAPLTSDTMLTSWSSKEVNVVRDLIANYVTVWQPNDAETRREMAVRQVLMRVLSNSVPSAPKAAGDLLTWVYVNDSTTCFHVALTPNKTSADVCIELCEKANIPSHLLALEEVICNESMRRIIHIDELVLDVVLRWSYWDEEDRKDAYLLVRQNKLLHEMNALKPTLSLVCGELKYASDSSKAFRQHVFEIKDNKLSCFKDKQGSIKLEEWDIKEHIWYIGHETKRNPQTRWSITFKPRGGERKRTKDRPWFGRTIAGAVTEDQLKWTTALTFAQHSNILPSPRLVIT